MADQTYTGVLRDLQKDGRFLELDRYVPPLQIVRSLGAERDELAHSRLLAVLLDPWQHRGAETMLRAMLRSICRYEYLAQDARNHLQEILGALWTNVDVQREFEFIDIVVQITTSRRTIVVGIENKIDAAEGEEQLSRYQRALEQAFLDQTSIMVFLTSTGRLPTTALDQSSVPVIPAGYEMLVENIEETLRDSKLGSRDRRVLSEIAAHIREEILDEEQEVKALVRELWKSHGKALHLAMEHRPRLEDIHRMYETLLRERFGNDINIYLWRLRGELREIKMSLPTWVDAGFPFEFMLYVDEELPKVRLLISQNSYEPRAEFLRKWARDVNASTSTLIDEDFKKLPRWGFWRRVLHEQSYPPEAILDEQAFDEATARAEVEAVMELYETVQPYIKTT